MLDSVCAGCLPTLATIPVFWGLYRTLSNVTSEGLLTEGFYWIPTLSGPITLEQQRAGAGCCPVMILGWRTQHRLLAFLAHLGALRVRHQVAMSRPFRGLLTTLGIIKIFRIFAAVEGAGWGR